MSSVLWSLTLLGKSSVIRILVPLSSRDFLNIASLSFNYQIWQVIVYFGLIISKETKFPVLNLWTTPLSLIIMLLNQLISNKTQKFLMSETDSSKTLDSTIKTKHKIIWETAGKTWTKLFWFLPFSMYLSLISKNEWMKNEYLILFEKYCYWPCPSHIGPIAPFHLQYRNVANDCQFPEQNFCQILSKYKMLFNICDAEIDAAAET